MKSCIPARAIFSWFGLWLGLAVGVCRPAQAQPALRLLLWCSPADSLRLAETDLSPPPEPTDSLTLLDWLQQATLRLQGAGFLEAACDRLERQDSFLTAHLHIGPPYAWATLAPGNVEPAFLQGAGFRPALFGGKPLQAQAIAELLEKLLAQAEDHGHPFARVGLRKLRFDGEGAEAELWMQKGPLVHFGELRIEGTARLAPRYLQHYLDIRPGTPFSRRKVLAIPARLRQLSFVESTQPPKVRIEGSEAGVVLQLQRKRASRFDFLIGVLPGERGAGQSRFLITGTLNAALENPFGGGERMALAFERLRPSTQELELSFAYPYLLDLPFGTELGFHQYRQEEYSNVELQAALQYFLSGSDHLKIFAERSGTTVLEVDTLALQQGRSPEFLDLNRSAFGLGLQLQRLDYRLNPRAGWSLEAEGSGGTKRIRENPAIAAVSETFYDTLQQRSFQIRIRGQLQGFLPLGRRLTLRLALSSGALFSDGGIFRNEQFRLGGNRLLRGFDEQALFATFYTVGTSELRLLLDTNSHLFLFTDLAYLEDRTPARRRFDRPFGLGAGITFDTPAGLFRVSLAVGSRQGSPLDFANPKVHFGYLSLF